MGLSTLKNGAVLLWLGLLLMMGFLLDCLGLLREFVVYVVGFSGPFGLRVIRIF